MGISRQRHNKDWYSYSSLIQVVEHVSFQNNVAILLHLDRCSCEQIWRPLTLGLLEVSRGTDASMEVSGQSTYLAGWSKALDDFVNLYDLTFVKLSSVLTIFKQVAYSPGSLNEISSSA